MSSCTVRGVGNLPVLPKTELNQLREFMQKIALLRCVSSKIEFKNTWISCLESIEQACKSLWKAIKEEKLKT